MLDPSDRTERRRQQVRELYDATHADRYEQTWQLSDVWSRESVHYVRSIGEHLHEGSRWLDVGCGTGYFLSRFPDVERAGIDLSPAMLARARANNPGDVELREGDIAVDIEEWHGQWDLVTSTGQAWGYLSSMEEIEQAARNMAAWTREGGVLLVQPADLTDLTGHRLDYDFSGEPPAPNTTIVTGAIWTYYEEDDVHWNQIWPSLDQWVNWLAHDFEKIEIANWPHDPPPPYLAYPRRILVASGKRAERAEQRATIVFEPLPEPPPPAPDPAEEAERARLDAEREADDARLEAERLEREAEVEREREAAIAANDAAWASLQAHADRMQARAETAEAALARLEAERAEQAARPEPVSPAETPGGRLVDLPLSVIVARYAPWRPRFWRGAKRRVNRLRSS